MIPGGWEIHETLSSEHMAIYDAIKGSLKNAEYVPLAVGSLSVGSKTLCFICKATQATGKEYFAKVTVSLPIGGDPQLQSTREILI